jgi:hypothetical protein
MPLMHIWGPGTRQIAMSKKPRTHKYLVRLFESSLRRSRWVVKAKGQSTGRGSGLDGIALIRPA